MDEDSKLPEVKQEADGTDSKDIFKTKQKSKKSHKAKDIEWATFHLNVFRYFFVLLSKLHS